MKQDDWGFPPYVSAAERRRRAERAARALGKAGRTLAPVRVEGRDIARTFWGRAWCENLERYSDFVNRLPRGRSYLRNGSVIDLGIEPGLVTALVSGTDLYEVKVKVAALGPRRFKALCLESAGAIDSLVDLLQGRFSKAVMERFCREGTGLFPRPREIALSCSCPDSAAMCKHVAAVLYGIGARLDAEPQLLFQLRCVDAAELLTRAGERLAGAGATGPAKGRLLRGANLAELFGLEIAAEETQPRAQRRAQTHAAGAAGAARAAGAAPQTRRKRARPQSRAPRRPKPESHHSD
jgi:uncharacterized Zn finger protein